jgi:PAS domain-containing protein
LERHSLETTLVEVKDEKLMTPMYVISLAKPNDRAEKKLRHSEARYRALAGNLNYGICRCSVEGRFLEVNQAMISMLGYGSKEELLSLDIACNPIQDPSQRAQLLGQRRADALANESWNSPRDDCLGDQR